MRKAEKAQIIYFVLYGHKYTMICNTLFTLINWSLTYPNSLKLPELRVATDCNKL